MYQTFIKPLFSDVSTFILDTLFPISCLGCGEEGEFICADCKVLMKTLEHQRCIVCQKNTPFGITHPHCQTPYGADGLISFYNYHDEKVAKIIIGGKYNFIPQTFELLGQMAAEKILTEHQNLLTANSYELSHVPLHTTRLRWRGFNQSEVLAQSIGKSIGIGHQNLLVRTKITKTQKDLNKEERSKNIAEAFKLKPGTDVHDKNIILVDDVTTTGATLQEAAKILKRNGAAKVICLTVARD
jgi:competence protein ComFC